LKLQTTHDDSQNPPTSASSCDDDAVGGRQLGDISADGVAELVTQGTLEETSTKCHGPIGSIGMRAFWHCSIRKKGIFYPRNPKNER